MTIKLIRTELKPEYTIGEIYIDNANIKYCDTVEDTYRPNAPKIPGQTCIPEGSYNVILTMSPHFKRIMPHVMDVPNFSGILIHPGNTTADTAGCILVGKKLAGKPVIKDSIFTFTILFEKIKSAIQQDQKVILEVSHLSLQKR